jgi:hypothetical protein
MAWKVLGRGKNSMVVDCRLKKKKTLELGGFDANLTVNLCSDYHMIRLGFLIFRKVQITIDLGGFETHRSGFKSKEMNPATLAPRILWLSVELLLD